MYTVLVICDTFSALYKPCIKGIDNIKMIHIGYIAVILNQLLEMNTLFYHELMCIHGQNQTP